MTHTSPLIEALLTPDIWPDHPECVELIETHISWVLITREFAWKLRKPVAFGFIDFSTLALRLRFAEEELRLNRRTSPQLYLGIVPITGTLDALSIGDDGPVIEYAVQMRRFEQDGLLLRIANAGPLSTAMMTQLAERLATFHQQVEAVQESSHFGSLDAVREDALDNFTALSSMVPSDAADALTLRKLHTWTIAELERLGPVIKQRHQSGKVRECHGDLHLANIVMVDDRPTLFDCLEFNERLRWIDVINEIAFLVMDLEEHQQHGASRVLLNRYLEVTGDYDGLRALRFYIVYRALVRAKVDLLRCHQTEDHATACKMRIESSEYLRLAAEDAADSRPMLIIMHGVSGSGKSYVSARLIEMASVIRIRSDIERKRLSGLGETQRAEGEANRQLYSNMRSEQTYEQLLGLAKLILSAGYSVVVDAVFMSREHREPFRLLSEQLGVSFLILACEAPEDVLRTRVRTRQIENLDASDADVSVLNAQLAADRGLDQEHMSQLIRIDTSCDFSIDDALQDVCNPLD